MPLKRHTLPNVKEAIILAIVGNGEVYGLGIWKTYTERTDRKMPYGSAYTTFDRMVSKGLLSRRRSKEIHPEHGGNHRVFFKATTKGRTLLSELRQSLA